MYNKVNILIIISLVFLHSQITLVQSQEKETNNASTNTNSSNSSLENVNLNDLVSKYEVILENIEQDTAATTGTTKTTTPNNFFLRAYKEISTNKQILIIPTTNIMSSEEDYQFKQYFSRSNKEKLIGRLLIEKFIAKESYFYEFIQSLPPIDSLTDYHHYNDANKDNLKRRSILNHSSFSDRKVDYESLVRKIPSNEIPTLLLNFELYNWAHSIIDCYGIQIKKKYYNEVKRLYRYSEQGADEDLAIIPGINLFKSSTFTYQSGNNLVTSLFAYKEHIYLNSDRFIDENNSVFNEIQFMPNIKLFETCGKFVSGFHHEEVTINLNHKDWTMDKYNLCKELDCMQIKNSNVFTLKHEFDYKLLNYCQIDQLFNAVDPSNITDSMYKSAFQLLRMNKKISTTNYLKAISKCSSIVKSYTKKKTPIEVDIKDLAKNLYADYKDFIIIKFTISQKKILNSHIQYFYSRIIKEFNKELFGDIKGKYV